MYLIDASALIEAKNHYYQFDRVPQFWNWLRGLAEADKVKVPGKIFDEICKQDDELKKWITAIKDDILVQDDDYDKELGRVLSVYGSGEPSVLEKLKADPYLIACALHFQGLGGDVTVVTGEVPRPRATAPGNRKVPDICAALGIPWTNTVGRSNSAGLIVLLDFRAK